MRTELMGRPFPYTCHTWRKPPQTFFGMMGAVFCVVFSLAFAYSAPPERTWVRATGFAFAFFSLFGLAAVPFISGYRYILPGRPTVWRGSTLVGPKLFPAELMLALGAAAATLVIGIANTFFDGPFPFPEAGGRGLIMGPVMFGLGVWLAAWTVWQQLRCVRLTPDGLTYRRDVRRINLGWDEVGEAISLDDVKQRSPWRYPGLAGRVVGEQSYYLPGIRIVIPAERARATRLPVVWEDDGTPRLLLEADHFRVEPSALITVILAMCDHPELRPLLGTRASKAFFVGPPWRVRRHMYRNQRWWPKGTAPAGVDVDADGVVKEPVPRMEIP